MPDARIVRHNGGLYVGATPPAHINSLDIIMKLFEMEERLINHPENRRWRVGKRPFC